MLHFYINPERPAKRESERQAARQAAKVCRPGKARSIAIPRALRSGDCFGGGPVSWFCPREPDAPFINRLAIYLNAV